MYFILELNPTLDCDHSYQKLNFYWKKFFICIRAAGYLAGKT